MSISAQKKLIVRLTALCNFFVVQYLKLAQELQ
jgi:hypothetical protein